MLDILYIVGFVVCGGLAPIFFLLGWKILRCPDNLWKEFQNTPRDRDYEIIQRILR